MRRERVVFWLRHGSHIGADLLDQAECPQNLMLVNESFLNKFIHGLLIDGSRERVQGADGFEHIDKQSELLLGMLAERICSQPGGFALGFGKAGAGE
jgi:hypothetical protein